MVTREWKGDLGVLPQGSLFSNLSFFLPPIVPHEYKDFGLTNFICSSFRE